MGEVHGAKALVDACPVDRFTPRMYAVAAQVHATWGHGHATVLGVLTAAYATDRGHELNVLAEELALPDGAVATLVAVIQSHRPAIRLSAQARAVLAALRQASWRLGLVTNGRPDIQGRKIAALGVTPLVDAVVIAAEHGSGRGKPEAAPFLGDMRVDQTERMGLLDQLPRVFSRLIMVLRHGPDLAAGLGVGPA